MNEKLKIIIDIIRNDKYIHVLFVLIAMLGTMALTLLWVGDMPGNGKSRPNWQYNEVDCGEEGDLEDYLACEKKLMNYICELLNIKEENISDIKFYHLSDDYREMIIEFYYENHFYSFHYENGILSIDSALLERNTNSVMVSP